MVRFHTEALVTDDSDDSDDIDLTPVGDVAARYSDPELRRLAVDIERRTAHRIMQSMAGKPLTDADRERIEDRMNRLHDNHRALHDVVNVQQRTIGEHITQCTERNKRTDEHITEAKEHRKAGAAGRWSLIVGVVTALGAAGVAFYQSAITKGDDNATLRQLVEQAREHDRDINQIRAQLFRALVRNPFMPDDPAPSGDTP